MAEDKKETKLNWLFFSFQTFYCSDPIKNIAFINKETQGKVDSSEPTESRSGKNVKAVSNLLSIDSSSIFR